MPKLPLALLVLAGLAAALPLPAAAGQLLTARASGVQALKAGPGNFYRTIGKLADQERVHPVQCTWHSNWCLVDQLDGGPSGWVQGSYLIGSGAKNAVTPYDFGFDPLHPGGLRPWR